MVTQNLTNNFPSNILHEFSIYNQVIVKMVTDPKETSGMNGLTYLISQFQLECSI